MVDRAASPGALRWGERTGRIERRTGFEVGGLKWGRGERVGRPVHISSSAAPQEMDHFTFARRDSPFDSSFSANYHHQASPTHAGFSRGAVVTGRHVRQ